MALPHTSDYDMQAGKRHLPAGRKAKSFPVMSVALFLEDGGLEAELHEAGPLLLVSDSSRLDAAQRKPMALGLGCFLSLSQTP